MADRTFLAYDLGAESGRAVLASLSGGKLTLEEKHRFPNPVGRMAGHLYWNILAQWEELKTGLRKATDELTRPLSGIGVDTWGVDFGLLSRDGELLGNPVHYRDPRTEGTLERTFARVPKEKIFQATGIQFMQLNSLFQLVAMREAKSQILEAAETLLFIPDLFNYLFTGQKKAEFSIATTSQMYDPRRRAWATDLLEALDLPTRILPEIIPPGTVLGPLKADVAAECGLTGPAAQTPVIATAGHDTAAAVAAVPADGVGTGEWCYISSGTWSLMGVELREPVINEKSLAYNYTNEGGVDGTIRFLKNIMGLWLVQECRRHWQLEADARAYAELTRQAGEAQPFAAVIDPDHEPFLRPGDMPGKIERFCQKTNQKPPASRGEVVRTCLESLALTYRKTLAGMEDILGHKVGVIHIVGGGCRNELLNQMTADACQRPVVAGPVEATAIGNVLVQAMATGDVRSLSDARRVVRDSFDVKRYEPGQAAAWDEAYVRYRAVMGK